MIVRSFNANGIETFRRFLLECRQNASVAVPLSLLSEVALTNAVLPRIDVTPQRFETKGDAARYLVDVLEPLPEHEVLDDAGLWTWLTLYYFDQVCPGRDGKRTVKNDYTYVFEPRNARHFYRHLLFIAWRALKLAGDHSRVFLSGKVSSLDKFTSEVMKRLYVTRIPCIFEVLDRLYWDETLKRARPGLVSPQVQKGDLAHRFPIRIRQLEMTYDLQSLDADQLIELLGPEFRHNGAGSPGAH